MTLPNSDDQIAAVRAFNRFYTRKLGVLDQQAAEKPVLAERGAGAVRTRRTAKTFRQGDRHRTRSRSRLSQPDRPEFRRRRIDHPQAPAADRRQYRLSLTAKGRQAFAKLDTAVRMTTSPPCSQPDARRRQRLSGAMATIERLLARRPAQAAGFLLRTTPRRHRMGGAEPRRALCQRIWLRRLVRKPGRGDRGASSSRSFEPRASAAGSPTSTAPRSARCFWSRRTDDVAKLRLLLVDPEARGQGWASGWSTECIRFARAAAIARSRCGPRASWSPRARSISAPDFAAVGGNEPHRSFGAGKPDRRDLGARSSLLDVLIMPKRPSPSAGADAHRAAA